MYEALIPMAVMVIMSTIKNTASKKKMKKVMYDLFNAIVMTYPEFLSPVDMKVKKPSPHK